jgi:hypothetical protein
MTTQSKHMTNFERLTSNLKYMSLGACQVGNKLTNLAHHPEVCIEHIFINQMVAKATVPLMKEVVRCAKAIPNDPTSEPLIKYMEQHIIEETNHDEWYVDDLEVFGISRQQVFERMPSPNIAAFIGSQYYWVKHHHPIAFMGYIACLEVYHSSVEYVENLIKLSGLPREGFATLMKHAIIDVEHSQDIIETLNTLPLTEEQYQIIEMSAFQTFRYVALVMEDVCKVAPTKVAAAG